MPLASTRLIKMEQKMSNRKLSLDQKATSRISVRTSEKYIIGSDNNHAYMIHASLIKLKYSY